MKIVISTLLLVGCTPDDVLDARKLPTAIQGDATEVVAGNNQFAVDAYHNLPAGNAVFSPFSVATAFAMLDAGAANQTDADLRTAFHFTLPGDRVHAAYGALLHSLDTGRSYGNYTLATANRLYAQQGFSLEPAFTTTLASDYESPLESVDFAGNADAARTTINSWVAGETDNQITDLFSPQQITSQTVLALANAMLFKGSWDEQFDTSNTLPGDFHVAGASTVTASMMHGSMTAAVATIPGGTLAILPFHGKDLGFLVLVPDDPDGLPALEAQLSGAALSGWIASAASETYDVSLPKFTLHSTIDLQDMLTTLGAGALFDPTACDLSGIDGARDLVVQAATHQAMIAVDEEGAVAAAATGVSVEPGAEPDRPLNVDHSFAFAIYDNVTGSVLFAGRVADPTAQ